MTEDEWQQLVWDLHVTGIKFRYQDGSMTFAQTPANALCCWLTYHWPEYPDLPTPEEMEPLTVYQTGPLMPGPENDDFMTVVLAKIEQLWGKTPDVDLERPDLEVVCWDLLVWLSVNGDIIDLTKMLNDACI